MATAVGFSLQGRSRLTAVFSTRVDRDLLARFRELAQAEVGTIPRTRKLGRGDSAVRIVLERLLAAYVADQQAK